jgi:hypothetical protein
MPAPVRRTLPLLLLAALLVPGAVDARKRDPDLWVTINRCDGTNSPDRMGVRASVPGNGTRQRMYVRFRAQFFDEINQRWQNVIGAGGRSQWFKLGDARVRARQAGYTFVFDAPQAGTQFVLRGVADFQYRRFRGRKGRKPKVTLVKRLRGHSRKGIRHVPGGDPPRRSSSICIIR